MEKAKNLLDNNLKNNWNIKKNFTKRCVKQIEHTVIIPLILLFLMAYLGRLMCSNVYSEEAGI